MSHNISYYIKNPNDIDHKTKKNFLKVQQLVKSKNFYKSSIYNLIINVLEFDPSELDDNLLQVHVKLKQLLNIFNLQILPPHLAINQNLQDPIYIIDKINLNNDADIAVVKELNAKAKLTKMDLNRINIATEKINNFNIMLRVFEALFVIAPQLNSAQKDFLVDKIYNLTLPHEATRYFIAYFSYISENSNPIYDFNQKDNFFAYLDSASNFKIIYLLAQIASKSHKTCNFISSYPYLEQLLQTYFKIKPNNHEIFKIDNSLDFKLLSYYRDLRNIEDIEIKYCSFLFEKVQANALIRLSEIPKLQLSTAIKENIQNFYQYSFASFKGNKLISQQSLDNFAAKNRDLYIPNINNIDILIDTTHLADKTKNQLHFLCKSKDKLICLGYPFIKPDCSELAANKDLYAYWTTYEKNALYDDNLGYNQELFLSNLTFCLILLPAINQKGYSIATNIFEKLRLTKITYATKIYALFMYLYIIDSKYTKTIDQDLKSFILSNEQLRKGLFYRICKDYTYIGQIPSNLRFIINYVLTYDFFKIKTSKYNYHTQAKVPDSNNRLVDLFSEIYAALEIKKFLNLKNEKAIIEKYKYNHTIKSNFLPKNFGQNPLCEIFSNVIALENNVFNCCKLNYSNKEIVDTLNNEIDTAISNISIEEEHTKATASKNKMLTNQNKNIYDIYKNIIAILSVLRLNHQCFAPVSATSVLSKVIDIKIIQEHCTIFLTNNKLSYNVDLVENLISLDSIIEAFVFIENPSTNFDRTIQSIILNLKIENNDLKMFLFEYCRAAYKYYANIFTNNKNHNHYLTKLARNFRDKIKYLFNDKSSQDQFIHNIAKTSFKNNNFNKLVAKNIEHFFYEIDIPFTLLQDILIQQSVYNKNNLDLAKIKQKMRESTEISNVISAIKVQDVITITTSDTTDINNATAIIDEIKIQDSDTLTENTQASNIYQLEPSVLKLLNLIYEHLEDDTILKEQLITCVKQCEFMSLAVALEQLNDISYEKFDEALLDYDEEDSIVYVTVAILNKLLGK